MTPETIHQYTKDIEQLWNRLLLDSDDMALLTPEAEQFFLLAIETLQTAQRFMKLAHYNRMQGR